MKFRSKNLLITGGAGFIGSNFIELLFEKYPQINVYNLDLLTYAGDLKYTSSFNKNKNYKFIKGDISDPKIVNYIFEKYKIDGVVNFAAETHVDNSIINPEIFIKTNICGVFNLLKNSYKFWMKSPHLKKSEFSNARFHHISTDEVYGSIQNGSFSEKDKYQPSSPYSSSKSSADMIVRSYHKTFGLNTTISCSSNNFGKNQNHEKFIPKIIKSIINNLEIPIYGQGDNVRDWIYVKDNCEAILRIFNNGLDGESYNVGANNEFTNLEILNIISNIMCKKPKIQFVDDRYAHDFRYSLNCTKIKDQLKWDCKYKFKEALKNYITNEYE